jgi:hypothetical protein
VSISASRAASPTDKQVEHIGVDGVLAKPRQQLKGGTYRPLPMRERLIPRRSGKLRRLGISTVSDKIVQTAAKLVLEPMFEAAFCPTSYGFRPGRRARDAIEEVRFFIHAPVGERPHLAGSAAAMSATYYDAGEEAYCAWIWPGVSSLRYIAASLIDPENAPLGWFGQPGETVPPSCQYPV